MDPESLIRWSYENFGDRVGIVTSFQDTGCVMIDMASRVAPGMRVLTVDTLRLHSETYAVMDKVERRYNLEVELYRPDADRLALFLQPGAKDPALPGAHDRIAAAATRSGERSRPA